VSRETRNLKSGSTLGKKRSALKEEFSADVLSKATESPAEGSQPLFGTENRLRAEGELTAFRLS